MTRPSAHGLKGAENARLEARARSHSQTPIQIQKEFAIPVLPLGCVATGTKMVAHVRSSFFAAPAKNWTPAHVIISH